MDEEVKTEQSVEPDVPIEETPVEEVAEHVSNPCADCKGTGLKDQFTICPSCNGTGIAKDEAAEYEEGTMVLKKGVGAFIVKSGKLVQV